MSIEKLIDNLNELFKFLDTTYYINSGGCCYVAYLIAREFDKRLITGYSLRIYNESYVLDKDKTLYNINNDRDDFPIHSETCTHYAIKYKNIIINSYYKEDSDVEYIDIDNIDSELMKEIYDKGEWNSDYDINNSIYIERFIKIIFNQYDTENSKVEM